jgi:intracellular sulfur oxidation DsrE/DsrF family protein
MPAAAAGTQAPSSPWKEGTQIVILRRPVSDPVSSKRMRRTAITLLSILISASIPALAGPSAPPATPDSALPAAPQIIGVTVTKNIRVVYDVKDDVWDAGIGKALYYVRGLLEAYKALDVPESELKISVILHGPTVYWALDEDAYRKYRNDAFDFNPNTEVIRDLLAHGVSIEICNATLKGKGWTAADLLPGTTIVHDAYTRLIDLQLRGYTYIRF